MCSWYGYEVVLDPASTSLWQSWAVPTEQTKWLHNHYGITDDASTAVCLE